MPWTAPVPGRRVLNGRVLKELKVGSMVQPDGILETRVHLLDQVFGERIRGLFPMTIWIPEGQHSPYGARIPELVCPALSQAPIIGRTKGTEAEGVNGQPALYTQHVMA